MGISIKNEYKKMYSSESIKVSELVEYIGIYGSSKRENTRKELFFRIKKFSEYIMIEIGVDYVKDIGERDIIRYKDYLISKGYKSTTVNGYFDSIRVLYRELEHIGIMNIVIGIRGLPQLKKIQCDVFRMSDIVTILGILRRGMYDDKRGYLLIYLLFTTGLSTWSIFSLRWGDIQYNSKAGSMMLRVQVKTKGEDREIYVILSDESLRLLGEYGEYYKLKNKIVGDVSMDWYIFGIRDKLMLTGLYNTKVSINKLINSHKKYKGYKISSSSIRYALIEDMVGNGYSKYEINKVMQFCDKNYINKYIEKVKEVNGGFYKGVDVGKLLEKKVTI